MNNPSAKILVVDDEHSVRWAFERALKKAGFRVILAETGRKGLEMFKEHAPDLTLLDIRMPEMDGIQVLQRIREKSPQARVIVMTAYSDMETTVSAMKHGAYDFLTKPFDIDACLTLIGKCLESAQSDSAQSESDPPNRPIQQKSGSLIGNSSRMQEIYKLIGKVSAEDITVLITGESGSGKELVAQAIHYNSNRSTKPFWAVNCTAVTESLMESELFGHEKGAFTGAAGAKTGVFELAQGGTLFLDEIGDMSLEMQAQLLRVLEEREIVRVGGSKRIKVDVRLITATNKDLRKFILENRFREDLFHRIKVIEIHLPPLRERPEDIPAIAEHFIGLLAQQRKSGPKKLSDGFLQALLQYRWPGNVRELRNVLDQACTLSRDQVILPEHLPPEIRGLTPPTPSVLGFLSTPGPDSAGAIPETIPEQVVSPPVGENGELIKLFISSRLQQAETGQAYEQIMDQVEKELLSQAMIKFKGNQVQTANFLGITRNTLRAKITKFGL
jgi:two-component system nitrogen regulation response regulator GlnG